jgi:hypothetical protein
MIDLLLQVGYILLVLAVISLFVCTIPIWLVVLVLVLLFPIMPILHGGKSEANRSVGLFHCSKGIIRLPRIYLDVPEPRWTSNASNYLRVSASIES